MKTSLFLVILLVLAIPSTGFSATIHVPKDHPTIQAAIDAAVNGDTVLVAPGVYNAIMIVKKSIVVKSSQGPSVTYISNTYGSNGVRIADVDRATVLDGFTINKHFVSGGINCITGSPTIINNIIKDNIDEFHAGGIRLISSSPLIANNIIMNNMAQNSNSNDCLGGGVYISGGSPEFVNNLIVGNSSDTGGGVYISGGQPVFKNNTISGNSADLKGGGVFVSNSSGFMIDSILWGNIGPVYPEINPGFSSTYCNIEGGYPGVGNINSNPLFMSGYHLQQDPCQPGIINPCVDAGSNLAMNLNMRTCATRSDGVGDSDIVDLGYHYGPYEPPSLTTDGYEIPEMLGGAIALPMDGGSIYAKRNYLIFGGVTGAYPGTVFPGGQVILPVNWDLFTNVIIAFANQPMFQHFMGQLDANGKKGAILNLPPIQGLAGVKMYFAFALVDHVGTWDFASNPVEVDIVP